MRASLLVLLTTLIIAAIFLFASIQEVSGSPSPRGRGGGGRESSRGGGSRFSGGSWGKSSSGYKSKSSGKSFAAKHWKKAVAFGAGAYVGHKISKAARNYIFVMYL